MTQDIDPKLILRTKARVAASKLMTLQEFNELYRRVLESGDYTIIFDEGGCIRLMDSDDAEFCPVTVVCNYLKHDFYPVDDYRAAGDALQLAPHIAQAIADLADNLAPADIDVYWDPQQFDNLFEDHAEC